ncbi:MAG: hypothetical protein ABMA01_18650 [Chthoniobacteraceae bacterium]
MGTLYYSDNLEILRRYVADGSMDLGHLDPPFNRARKCNAFFQEKDGTAAAQIQAFEDTWEWNSESQRAHEEISLRSDKLGTVMRVFMEFLGPTDMVASRLVELRRALKPTGSLYLQCHSHHNELQSRQSIVDCLKNETLTKC